MKGEARSKGSRRTRSGGSKETFLLLSLCYHFDPGRNKLLDRPKPFSHMQLRKEADPHSGDGSGRGLGGGDSGPRPGGYEQGFRARVQPVARDLGRASSFPKSLWGKVARRMYKTKWSVGVDRRKTTTRSESKTTRAAVGPERIAAISAATSTWTLSAVRKSERDERHITRMHQPNDRYNADGRRCEMTQMTQMTQGSISYARVPATAIRSISLIYSFAERRTAKGECGGSQVDAGDGFLHERNLAAYGNWDARFALREPPAASGTSSQPCPHRRVRRHLAREGEECKSLWRKGARQIYKTNWAGIRTEGGGREYEYEEEE